MEPGTSIPDPPPGCLVLLLDLSGGMGADVTTTRGEVPAFVAARLLADELVEGLVNTHAAGYAVGALDVAVLGYRAPEGGAPELLSLLPDGDPKPRFVPLAQLAEMPAEARATEGQPRKWTALPPVEGGPCPTGALARVYQMVAVWLTGRYASRAPVVVHCTGGAAPDEAYLRAARSLNLLTTVYGPVRLLHYLFAATPAGGAAERLAEVSAELPESAGAAKPARRAVFVNDWDIADPWGALFEAAAQDDGAWAAAGGFDRARALWAHKMGNTPEQWEDAYALADGAAAVADGASSGIYCRTWAQQLSERFLTDRPDARDPAALNKWVNGLRTEWRAAIGYDTLNWSKQAKVDQVGAAATLLALELGPADPRGARRWKASAVGDASLFWVRDGRLLATFPVVAADQFGSAPLLVRSNPGFRTVAVGAAGVGEPGDRFVLATDAVAAHLFRSLDRGTEVDWSRFETVDEAAWRDELDALRRANDMVNDDCTLVVLRVGDTEASGVRQPPVDTSEMSEGSEQSQAIQQGADAPRSPQDSDGAIAAGAGDLMIDLPHEPPPGDSTQATRDGFPDPTDPGV